MSTVDSSTTDLDAKTNPESSTEVTEESQDANTPAESSNADEGAKGPESMFDAVKEVMDRDKATDEESPTSDEEKDETDAETGDTDAESEDGEGEKDEDLPFHNHPRWQEMVQKNRELEERAKASDELMEFTEQAGLNQEELTNGLSIMHLLKTDPYKAREALLPYMEQLDKLTGQGGLPEDLQQQIDAGRITEEYARELNQARAKAQHAESRVAYQQEQSQREQQAQQEEQLNQLRSQMRDSVTAWEAEWKKSDPDFDKKQPLVTDRVRTLIQTEGPPASVEQALELTKRARTDIEKHLKSITPGRSAQKRTVTGGSSVNKATPQPSSMLEAVRNAAQKS
ncbi:MAG: hypothetical protein RI563_11735 [Thiohalophilus sp.]|uniref:hypothetical protein n=1 Tax=Thiohalophilus sp. TaxID=3028392 RepID=UPI0028706CA2|nr:hypothetical protein [Thiohalophilus sp.]MDR9437545.1 hypothetical protein [Thiohalophilus sp.]